MSVVSHTSDLLSRREAADYLGIKPETLALWASVGRYDLPYVRIGKRAKYRKADLDKFIDEQTATSTAARREGASR